MSKEKAASRVQDRQKRLASEDVMEREGVLREGRRERTDGEWWRDGLGVVCILETQQDAVMDRN